MMPPLTYKIQVSGYFFHKLLSLEDLAAGRVSFPAFQLLEQHRDASGAVSSVTVLCDPGQPDAHTATLRLYDPYQFETCLPASLLSEGRCPYPDSPEDYVFVRLILVAELPSGVRVLESPAFPASSQLLPERAAAVLSRQFVEEQLQWFSLEFCTSEEKPQHPELGTGTEENLRVRAAEWPLVLSQGCIIGILLMGSGEVLFWNTSPASRVLRVFEDTGENGEALAALASGAASEAAGASAGVSASAAAPAPVPSAALGAAGAPKYQWYVFRCSLKSEDPAAE